MNTDTFSEDAFKGALLTLPLDLPYTAAVRLHASVLASFVTGNAVRFFTPIAWYG